MVAASSLQPDSEQTALAALRPGSANMAKGRGSRSSGLFSRQNMFSLGLALGTLALATWSAPALAVTPQGLPCGMTTKELVNGFGYAVDFCVLDSTRTILLTKAGQVSLVRNGQIEVEVLSLGPRLFWEGEMGMLSCAVDPDWATNGYVYLGFTVPAPTKGRGRTVISRFTYDTTIERIVPETEVVLLGSCSTPADCIDQERPNHALGSMAFGPDGYLYIAKGDGDSYEGENWGNLSYVGPHDLDSYLGKILRVDKTTGLGVLDNPYCGPDVAANSARCRIWATGVRNAWTFNFVPATGNVLAYDVGWYRTEAMKLLKKGADGGWPCHEGRQVAFEPNAQTCSDAPPVFDPKSVVYEYEHNGQGASIIGGAFFGERFPTYYHDKILLADYVLGTLFTVSFPSEADYYKQAKKTPGYMLEREDFGTFALSVVKVKPGPNGNIWIMGLDNNGYVREISYDAKAVCDGMVLLPQTPTNIVEPTPAATTPTANADWIAKCRPTWVAAQPALPDGSQLTGVTNVGNLPTLIQDYNADWGPFERNSNVGGNSSKDGTPITLAGTRYTAGIGTRAPSTIRVPLGGLCSEFSTVVGIDDISFYGEATVQIYGDGLLLGSGVVARGRTAISFDLGVVGMQQLTLVASPNDGSANTAVDVDWANPILYCGDKAPFLPRVAIQPSGNADINVVAINDTVTFVGKAFDFNGAPLDADAFDWSLNLVHCQGSVCHIHPEMVTATKTREFTFTIFDHADCVSFEVHLSVKDSCGYENSAKYILRLASAEPLCYPPGTVIKRY